MGILDNYFDPEAMAAMKQISQPSEEDRRNARNNGLINAGFAMMMNNGGRDKNQALFNALGAGGMAGVGAYQGSLDNARQAQQQQLTQGMQLSKILEEQKRKADMQKFMNSDPNIPAEVRAGVIPYADYWKRQNPEDQYKTVGDSLVKIDKGQATSVFQNKKLPDGMEIGPDGNPRFMPSYLSGKKEIASSGRSSTNVHLPPMESEEQKALGKDLAEQYSGIQKAGLSASATSNNLNRMKTLLTGIETGKLTPASMEVSGVLDSLGIKIDPKLPQKQAATALANELALRAKNSGGENLMPGAMSDPDRRFLIEMVPGLANTPGGNAMIIETLQRKAKRDVEVSKMAREYRQKNKTLNGFSEELADYSAKNPLFDDLQKSAPSSKFKIIGVR